MFESKTLRNRENERFLDFWRKNHDFGFTKHPSAKGNFQNRRSQSCGDILIQIFFVGLTNISTCRKHDFSIGGRFFCLRRKLFTWSFFQLALWRLPKSTFFGTSPVRVRKTSNGLDSFSRTYCEYFPTKKPRGVFFAKQVRCFGVGRPPIVFGPLLR